MSASEGRPLEEITLIGYKSFRELKNFRLKKGLNVLIGANGSGKTNFIRFFELLGHLMDPNKGLQNYVSARGRADAFLFRLVWIGFDPTDEVRDSKGPGERPPVLEDFGPDVEKGACIVAVIAVAVRVGES